MTRPSSAAWRSDWNPRAHSPAIDSTWCRGGIVGITLDPPTPSSLAPTMSIQIVDFRNKHRERVGSTACRPADRRQSAPAGCELFQRRHPAIPLRHLVEHSRQVAHPLFGIRILLPDSRPRGARKRGRGALGVRNGRRLCGAGGLRRNLGSHRRLHQVLRDLRSPHLKSAWLRRLTA